MLAGEMGEPRRWAMDRMDRVAELVDWINRV